MRKLASIAAFVAAALGSAAGAVAGEPGADAGRQRLVADPEYRPEVGDRASIAMTIGEAEEGEGDRDLPPDTLYHAPAFTSREAFREWCEGGARALAELGKAGRMRVVAAGTSAVVLALEEVGYRRDGEARKIVMGKVRALGGPAEGRELFVAAGDIARLVPDPRRKAFARETAPLRVLEVLDGPTVVVKAPTGTARFRLLGVGDPPRPAGGGEGPGAGKAGRMVRDLLEALIGGGTVYAERDASSMRPDPSGAIPAYLYRSADGLFLNRWLIERGYGRAAAGGRFGHADEFLALERRAEAGGLGLWSPAGGIAEGDAGAERRSPDIGGAPVGRPSPTTRPAPSRSPRPVRRRFASQRQNALMVDRVIAQMMQQAIEADAQQTAAYFRRLDPTAYRPSPGLIAPSPPRSVSHPCGAPTQAGRYCRRSVPGPGPGYCYQHRGY